MLEVEKTIQEAKKASLYLHRIPHNPPKKLGPYYSAEVVFSSHEEANQAFDNVNGDIVKYLDYTFVKMFKTDSEVSAKKRSNTEEIKLSSKRQRRENDAEETREDNEYHRKEIEELKENHIKETEELKEKLKAKEREFERICENHLKETEELKEKLKAKDREVEAQDKMISNLKKKLKKK
ncbi:unnamed protein product [Brassica napus]|uniref:(rape) hypothetical protein n=1 Tax=Brassica napus TaxID=3708 RepID=A0A816IL82_BRANA|nr:unnamed protein product [Brassica napus]